MQKRKKIFRFIKWYKIAFDEEKSERKNSNNFSENKNETKNLLTETFQDYNNSARNSFNEKFLGNKNKGNFKFNKNACKSLNFPENKISASLLNNENKEKIVIAEKSNENNLSINDSKIISKKTNEDIIEINDIINNNYDNKSYNNKIKEIKENKNSNLNLNTNTNTNQMNMNLKINKESETFNSNLKSPVYSQNIEKILTKFDYNYNLSEKKDNT